jgi:hypothetical protein
MSLSVVHDSRARVFGVLSSEQFASPRLLPVITSTFHSLLADVPQQRAPGKPRMLLDYFSVIFSVF